MKNKTRNKIFALLAAAGASCMAFGISACFLNASVSAKALSYTLSDDGTYYTLTSVTSTEAEIEVPEEYEGLPVKAIGNNAFKGNEAVSTIVLPDSVTTIGTAAFYGCTSLSTINIPDSVTVINQQMFYNCTSLADVDMPDGTTEIKQQAFYNCSSLTSISIPAAVTAIGENAFYGCESLKSVYLTDIAAWCGVELSKGVANPMLYGGNLYVNNSLVTKLTIPEGVTTLNYDVFASCASIESVEFPSTLTEIGEYAFAATPLKSVDIPDGVTTIGSDAFGSCESLESVTIPASVTKIGKYAFTDCTALTEINFNAKEMTDLDEYNYVFSNAGQYSTGIDVTIGAAVTVIPANLFCPDRDGNTTKVSTVMFADGSVCTKIGSSAFRSCYSLTTFTIPKNVKTISEGAFYNCPNLVQLCNLSSLSLTVGGVGNGYVAYYADRVYTNTKSNSLTNQDGYIFYNGTDGYYLVSYRGTDTELTLPEFAPNGSSVNYTIHGYAFYCNKMITKVTIPDSVKEIGEYAFRAASSLTEVITGDGVTTIGVYSFGYCTALESISIGSSVTKIRESAFNNCSNLSTVTYNGSQSEWTNITITERGNDYISSATKTYLK